LGIPLPHERDFEEVIMVEVLIEEMFGLDSNRPSDYKRAVVVNAEQTENNKRRKIKALLSEKSAQKVFDAADMVRDVR
jgi:hypothetical protein